MPKPESLLENMIMVYSVFFSITHILAILIFTHINSMGFEKVKLGYSDGLIKPILLFYQINTNSLE